MPPWIGGNTETLYTLPIWLHQETCAGQSLGFDLGRCAQDSLGGNAKTMIIANISPAQEHAAETASTLAFASRAKCIRNSAVINQDVRGDAELMRRELERLQRCTDHLCCSPKYIVCRPS